MKNVLNNGSMNRKVTSALCAVLLLAGSFSMQTLAAVPVGVTGITPIANATWSADYWAFTINLDENIAATGTNNMQANADSVLKAAVRDNIIIDGKTLGTILTEKANDYAVMVTYDGTTMTFFSEKTQNIFPDNVNHSLEILTGLTDLTKAKAFATVKYYYNATSKLWSTNKPGIAVTSLSKIAEPSWGTGYWALTLTLDTVIATSELTNVQMLSDPYIKAAVRNNILLDGKTIDTILAEKGNEYVIMVAYSNNTLSLFSDKANNLLSKDIVHKIEILPGLIDATKVLHFAPAVYFYNPTSETWSTSEIAIPTPTPGAAVEIFNSTPLLMNGNYGTAYFYLTGPITSTPTINVQAGGGAIPDSVRDTVRNFIKIDGKTVSQWNNENDTDYAVMVAYESESSGTETLGRLSFWIDTTSTCNFISEIDHTVEFLPGLIGLNLAPITPSTWEYEASVGEWVMTSVQLTPTPTLNPTGAANATPTESAASTEDQEDDVPATSDNGFAVIVLALIISAGMILFIIKKRIYSK